MLTRRHFVAAATLAPLAAPAILRAQGAYAAYPYTLGVAAGDPAPDGFVIWTRLAPDPLADHGGMAMVPVPVGWEVASDEGFRTIVAKGEATARPELAHSVHVEVAGLQPDRPYWYRFIAGTERSMRGRARTLPAPNARLDQIRFAVAGCQHYEQGFYGAYRAMAAEELAFVYHYGDYIYEGRGQNVSFNFDGRELPLAREHVGQVCYDLTDYRRRYAQVKSDRDLQRAHEAAAFWSTFDDHEVANNWVADIDARGAPPELFRTRRAAAFQAWYEHMPVRAAAFPNASGIRIHRGARYGDLIQASFLDTRQFRSDQPCGDDFKPACPEIDSAKAEVLGREQEAWLAGRLDSDARWTMIAQQVMMMEMDRRTRASDPQPIVNMDTWAGYRAPRRRMIERLRGKNAVVLTGDEHQNWAGLLNDASGKAAAVEFVGTSISSGGDGSDKRDGDDVIRRNNPHLAFTNDQRGFLLCEVDRDVWRTNVMVMDRVTSRDGRISKRATLAVERGKPAIDVA